MSEQLYSYWAGPTGKGTEAIKALPFFCSAVARVEKGVLGNMEDHLRRMGAVYMAETSYTVSSSTNLLPVEVREAEVWSVEDQVYVRLLFNDCMEIYDRGEQDLLKDAAQAYLSYLEETQNPILREGMKC